MSLLALAFALATGVAVLFATLWTRARRRAAERRAEAERLRAELGQAHAARETFFDLATHELRSPLSAILGYQELLADGAYGGLGDIAAEPVERIGRSARHLLHLIDGVVEVSRLRSGTVRADLGPVNLGVLLASVADAFRTAARERGLEPRVSLPDGLPTVNSDQDRLVRALDMMVTSAVKHPADTRIALEIDAHPDGATVRIGETEIEEREEAGDPALRLGIRLAVAEGIARLLGGELQRETRDDGCIHALVFRIRTTDRTHPERFDGPDPAPYLAL